MARWASTTLGLREEACEAFWLLKQHLPFAVAQLKLPEVAVRNRHVSGRERWRPAAPPVHACSLENRTFGAKGKVELTWDQAWHWALLSRVETQSSSLLALTSAFIMCAFIQMKPIPNWKRSSSQVQTGSYLFEDYRDAAYRTLSKYRVMVIATKMYKDRESFAWRMWTVWSSIALLSSD